ncbi:MAG: antibiotic biosynthesis monooxygenase family protein [Ktedonobacterales bacterium]
MFVTVFRFHAKPGAEATIPALFEQWQRDQLPAAAGYVAGELLRDATDPRHFIAVARFESEAALRALAATAEQDAWYRRLTAMTEREPEFTDCEIAWRAR